MRQIAQPRSLTLRAPAASRPTPRISLTPAPNTRLHTAAFCHADIVGPFKASIHGQYQYALILVDDHSRFKFVYALKHKSDAVKAVRSFVAEFNALLNQHRDSPVRLVGSLHTDNAGEFLSREFQDLLDSHAIDQTTCPPHVHSLNGVAERAIRSIVEVMRANLVASGASPPFWNYAMDHAVDVLNRTTGPPDSPMSSYEALTGSKPKVCDIMPFGCRSYAVKPASSVVKTEISPHAWVGINLGRSSLSPGSFLTWLPRTGRVVNSSEVYFQEELFPWRPKGDQVVGPSSPVSASDEDDDAVSSQPPGVPPLPGTSPPAPVAVASSPSLPDAYRRALGLGATSSSRKVLVLFSGPYRRPDGWLPSSPSTALNVSSSTATPCPAEAPPRTCYTIGYSMLCWPAFAPESSTRCSLLPRAAPSRSAASSTLKV